MSISEWKESRLQMRWSFAFWTQISCRYKVEQGMFRREGFIISLSFCCLVFHYQNFQLNSGFVHCVIITGTMFCSLACLFCKKLFCRWGQIWLLCQFNSIICHKLGCNYSPIVLVQIMSSHWMGFSSRLKPCFLQQFQ